MSKKTTILVIFLCTIFALNTFGETTSGTFVMDFDMTHQTKGKEVRLWIPYPVSDSKQVISHVNIKGDYTEAAVYTDRVFETPMLFARWDQGLASRKLRFSFHAQRDEVTPPDFPKEETSWDPKDYAIYLAATRLGPIDGEVKGIADVIVGDKKGVLEKAKAIYDWTVENTYRDPATRGCGLGDVYRLLKNPGGKCADISSIYVALARAAGVPSREVFGIRMGKEPGQDISTWQHCWAEFFLPGQGWVSVDPADVRKMMLVKNLKLRDNKTIEYREYFFGGIDANRIKLAEGRDLSLSPPQHGEPVNYLMYPYAQVGRETIDWLDPASFKYTIHFEPAAR